ncbi:hypothetical protein [Spiroplasma sp. SV19]|uniref:hypothetical protein n=1 Tax=Spiroplasma sp. SV19 TaxID=2570468 RepID=UPI0024B834E7|nr:hypothetical protein [Spiroplasma sp. SV19]
MKQKNKQPANSCKIQLKISKNMYNQLQQYTDKDHSLANVIRHFIKEGMQKHEKEDN